MSPLIRSENQDGSIYLECLLSFFIWIVILTILLPCYMNLTVSRKELILENEAQKIASNQYMKLIDGNHSDSIIVGKNGVNYTIKYQELESNVKKICVDFALINNHEKEICRTLFSKL